MARQMNEGMKAQMDKKKAFFLKYFPSRIRKVSEEAKAARKLIYAFKVQGTMLTRRWRRWLSPIWKRSTERR